MPFKEDPSTAADFLRKAVPLMVQRQIPTNPHNYALWYSHVANTNPELSRKLLFEFPTPGTYDPEKSEQLFFEYFVKNHLPENGAAQNALVALLTQLFGAVNKTTKGTQQFSQSLQQAITTLESSEDSDQIQRTLNSLLTDTDTIAALTKEFQSELEVARNEVESLKQQLKETKHSALTDELTQVGNRRLFDQTLENAMQDELVTNSLILLDIDHFKRCNDLYGHQVGDKVLARFGSIMAQHEQAGNSKSFRYGGEEFAIIFEGNAASAAQYAEQIRADFSASQFDHNGTKIKGLTASAGIAEAHINDCVDSLLKRADSALYLAKSEGRNRIVTG